MLNKIKNAIGIICMLSTTLINVNLNLIHMIHFGIAFMLMLCYILIKINFFVTKKV